MRNLAGYLDTARPHCINHLIVDFLGQEEIVLVCCDDGDVIAYRTRHVQHAIECNSSPDFPPDAYEARPFFKENVTLSAWGLSIHTKSRRIAVSSNTHKVTIFSFALADSDRADSDNEAHHISDSSHAPLNFPDRRDNATFVLPSTGNNVPCVAFCNTGDDPDGRYLVTGDIKGNTFIWALQGPKIIENYSAHYCYDNCECKQEESGGGTFSDGVWGLYFLDRRSFRRAGPLLETAQGLGNIQSRSSTRNRGAARNRGATQSSGLMDEKNIDISKMAASVPRSSRLFWINNPNVPVADAEEDMGDAARELNLFEDPDGMPGWDIDRQYGHLSQMKPKSFVWTRSIKTTEETEQDERFPNTAFLQISHAQIFLHQPREPHLGYPTISMNDPLKQYIPMHIQWALDVSAPSLMAMWNRISLHASIPELGVVVVGTYNGRCGVISLLQGESETGETIYYWKMDWLLPFQDQEHRHERPGTYLIGLAVSPLQGMGGRRSDGVARKWRLMLHYYNHSILSYEISRDGLGDMADEIDIL